MHIDNLINEFNVSFLVNEPTKINYMDFNRCCSNTASAEQNQQQYGEQQDSQYQEQHQQQQQQTGGGLDVGGLFQQGLNMFGNLGR